MKSAENRLTASRNFWGCDPDNTLKWYHVYWGFRRAGCIYFYYFSEYDKSGSNRLPVCFDRMLNLKGKWQSCACWTCDSRVSPVSENLLVFFFFTYADGLLHNLLPPGEGTTTTLSVPWQDFFFSPLTYLSLIYNFIPVCGRRQTWSRRWCITSAFHLE